MPRTLIAVLLLAAAPAAVLAADAIPTVVAKAVADPARPTPTAPPTQFASPPKPSPSRA